MFLPPSNRLCFRLTTHWFWGSQLPVLSRFKSFYQLINHCLQPWRRICPLEVNDNLARRSVHESKIEHKVASSQSESSGVSIPMSGYYPIRVSWWWSQSNQSQRGLMTINPLRVKINRQMWTNEWRQYEIGRFCLGQWNRIKTVCLVLIEIHNCTAKTFRVISHLPRPKFQLICFLTERWKL